MVAEEGQLSDAMLLRTIGEDVHIPHRVFIVMEGVVLRLPSSDHEEEGRGERA